MFDKKLKNKLAKALHDNEILKNEINTLRDYFESTSVYHGSYPSWKALQEFRDLIQSFGIEIKNIYHFVDLDGYLERIHNATESVVVSETTEYEPKLIVKGNSPQAKGVDYLEEILRRQPEIRTLLHKVNNL